MTQANDMRQISRFITSHDDSGKTIFDDTIPEQPPFKAVPDGAAFSLCYATNQFPVDMNGDKDLATYRYYLENLPGLSVPTGTVLRMVDMQPGALAPMHRTVSLDYGVVLDGEVELILDSGAKRLMRRGDISIQRGTNHTWKNASSTNWARMLYVLQPAEPLVVGGETLGEESHSLGGGQAST